MVAVKKLKHDTTDMTPLMVEAKILSKLRHPNVLAFYGITRLSVPTNL